MPSFIFVVDQENFKTCVRQGVCGVPLHENLQINARALADLAAIKRGSRIGFYVKGDGIYGYFRAKGPAFYDQTQLWIASSRTYPYRILIEETEDTFERPIALVDLYDLADNHKLWSWRGIVQRDCHSFTESDTLEIMRLLKRSNPQWTRTKGVVAPYTPSSPGPLPIQIRANKAGRVINKGGPEAYMMAWFLRQFSECTLREVFGNYTDYISLVPTSHSKEMDILLFHETESQNRILESCTIVELKVGKCDGDDLRQIIKYEDWLIKNKCSGDGAMVRSFIVAHKFSPDVQNYVSRRAEMEDKVIRLLRYEASGGEVRLYASNATDEQPLDQPGITRKSQN